MELTDRRVVITGGAGHVGAQLALEVKDHADVLVLDDLSSGDRDRVPDGVAFHRVDVTDPTATASLFEDAEVVFHLAVAEKDVAAGAREQFQANVDVTFGVLEAAIDAGVEQLVFASSSTVYGELAPRPTPESYGPLAPISAYGAAKAAEEAILATSVETADLTVAIARLANVVGPVFDGSVIPDFVEKLKRDPDHLEILGDGRQEKSFIHVEDVASALVTIASEQTDPYDVYNVGTPTATSIRTVAELVAEVSGCDPTFAYTGGDRGWTGDVPRMLLDVDRLQSIGWSPAYDCEAAVRRAARQLAGRTSASE